MATSASLYLSGTPFGEGGTACCGVGGCGVGGCGIGGVVLGCCGVGGWDRGAGLGFGGACGCCCGGLDLAGEPFRRNNTGETSSSPTECDELSLTILAATRSGGGVGALRALYCCGGALDGALGGMRTPCVTTSDACCFVSPASLVSCLMVLIIAAAASTPISGSRPGFCCGVDWMRNSRYLLASTHARAASGSVGMGTITSVPTCDPSSRRATSYRKPSRCIVSCSRRRFIVKAWVRGFPSMFTWPWLVRSAKTRS